MTQETRSCLYIGSTAACCMAPAIRPDQVLAESLQGKLLTNRFDQSVNTVQTKENRKEKHSGTFPTAHVLSMQLEKGNAWENDAYTICWKNANKITYEGNCILEHQAKNG
mmetsp:Transcript_4215/g.4977  ORF Transcript_4215/g.4977 Transcript_4215/m.4977 type:complete len:110 (-) Transcript_4215:1135-1464(-)|eukprot:Skav233498  [mRNA]  locus=scaffold2687:51181:51510:+ [translate_table: standard]